MLSFVYAYAGIEHVVCVCLQYNLVCVYVSEIIMIMMCLCVYTCLYIFMLGVDDIIVAFVVWVL